eukprot:GCRY01002133.1.p1 GENE.GCRY01002133.1~~GCRY01002133.1.p1  ORF type:complete len:368 (+),score=85.52 GCRY01002133.1:137-1240(+)
MSGIRKENPEELFDLIDKLGQGNFGTVWRGIHKESGKTMAIKVIPVAKGDGNVLKDIQKETQIMEELNGCSRLVEFYGAYLKGDSVWIAMEYMKAGSIKDIMNMVECTWTEEQIRYIIKSAALGLQFLHRNNKIHRDIKADNILVDANGHCKLADFGVSGTLSQNTLKRMTVVGSPYWMSPELISEIGYDTKADIWSLGITAIELVEGKPPLADVHPMRAIFKIPMGPPPTLQDPTAVSQEFLEFLDMCLVKDPNERKTADELLAHPFLEDASEDCALIQDVVGNALDLYAEHGRDSRKFGNRKKDAGPAADDLEGGETIQLGTLELSGGTGNSSDGTVAWSPSHARSAGRRAEPEEEDGGDGTVVL